MFLVGDLKLSTNLNIVDTFAEDELEETDKEYFRKHHTLTGKTHLNLVYSFSRVTDTYVSENSAS